MSDVQATSNLSLKTKINIGIVAYIIVAFSMLGWVNSARHDYREGRRDAEERYLQDDKDLEKRFRDLTNTTIPELFIEHVPLSRQTEKIQKKWYPPKPLILRLDDMIAFAVLGAFIGAGWLGLQLLAILLRNTLRMGARAIAEGKAEAFVGEDSVVKSAAADRVEEVNQVPSTRAENKESVLNREPEHTGAENKESVLNRELEHTGAENKESVLNRDRRERSHPTLRRARDDDSGKTSA